VRHPLEPKSERELLGEVEDLIARRGRRLAFPPRQERRFETETGPRYAQIMSAALRRTAVYYNLFLVGDFLLTPDTVKWAAALHFLLVTPVMLLAALIYRRQWPPLLRDIGGALVPVFIAAQILCIFAISGSPTASHYLYFVALNAATVNTSLQLRHRAATWATWATFVALVGTLAATHKIPIEVSVMQGYSFVICGLVTLRGAADREREFRRAYLNGLRDRLRIAAADAEANRDALTGAANRRGLDAAARATWAAANPAEAIAVILFDVDKFKAYNDLYGHPAGDICLRSVAEAAQVCLASRGNAFARYGGEEFLALLTGAAAEQAERIAEELRQAVLAMQIPHAGAAYRGVVSASFGVARARAGEMGFAALTAAADAALYDAKSAGRNRVMRAAA
jgi:diguanylate cyclase (GGDEF)-like protein